MSDGHDADRRNDPGPDPHPDTGSGPDTAPSEATPIDAGPPAESPDVPDDDLHGNEPPAAAPASRSARSRRRRSQAGTRTRSRALVLGAAALVVVLAVGAVVLWPRPAPTGPGARGLHIDDSVRPTGPVEIIGADALLIWQPTPDTPVTMTVRNRTGAATRARVWWSLAAPSEPRPWEHNAMQALPVEIDLDGHAQERIDVRIPPGILTDGYYRLSLWAHAYDETAAAWEHSDGRSVIGAIQVMEPAADLLHVAATSEELWVRSVSLPGTWVAGERVRVHVSVVNARPEPRVVRLWWYLAPPDTADPWEAAGAVRSEEVTIGVDGGAMTGIDVPIDALPNAGRYQFSVWLHESRADGSEPADGAFGTEPVTVVTPG